MNDSENAKRKDRQASALLASVGIIVGFVIYWSLEIQAVREMLELAYG
ncbi:MAG: hypothetical protein HKN19_05570 [Halioglobus sp.]|nr:hypothetical protein [Halioglobus sp.]